MPIINPLIFQVALIFIVSFLTGANSQNKNGLTRILSQKFERLLNNGYNFFYKQSDGQTRNEVGSFDNDKKMLQVKGSYSYRGDDNKMYKVQYIADENGEW